MNQRPFIWEQSYPAGMTWDLDVPRSTVTSLLEDAANSFRDRPAIDFRGRELSFLELKAKAMQAAEGFMSLGIGKESPLSLYLPNVPYHPIAFFGGMLTGAPLVHLSPLDAGRELAHKIQDSGSKAIFTTNFANMLPLAIKLLDEGLVRHVIVGEDEEWGRGEIPLAPVPEREGVIPFKSLTARSRDPIPFPQVAPEDVALLQYTGGTTGLPKGAILTHANIIAAVSSYKACAGAMGFHRPGEEIAICVLPLFHIYALTTVLLRNIQDGNKILLHARFDPRRILDDIESKQATVFAGSQPGHCGGQSVSRNSGRF